MEADACQCVPEVSMTEDVLSGSPKSVIDRDLEMLLTKLNLPEKIEKKASSVFEALRKKDESKVIPKSDLTVCAIYIVAIDMRMPYSPSDPQLEIGYLEKPDVTITEILQKSNISVAMLFKWMNVLHDASLSEAVRCHLKQLEKDYCIVSALHHTYERLCKAIFSEEEQGNTIQLQSSESVCCRKELCWVLFLLAKVKLLTDGQIVDAFYILVCCYEYVLRTTPAFQLNHPFDKVSFCDNSERQPDLMLQTLCNHFHLSYEEVMLVKRNRTDEFLQKLCPKDEPLDFRKLKEKYESNYEQQGDLNELLFLSNDAHLQPLEQNGNLPSPRCDEPDGPPVTPVSELIEKINCMSVNGDSVEATIRAALNTIQQLKNILISAKDEPSVSLLEFFDNCSMNPTASIQDRVTRLKSLFITGYVQLSNRNQTPIAEQRFMLAKRLYYRVMESMLNCEKERLSETDFSKLLNIDTFHVSLLACSIEIVMMTYGASWNASFGTVGAGDSKYSFPWILEVFGLHAYDFFKVLESFIKAEPILTKDIVKHLQKVEIQVLESLAWKADSPVFDAIAKSEISQMALSVPTEVTPVVQPSSADLYLSPMHPLMSKSRGTSPSYKQSPQKTPVSTGTEISSPEKGPIKRSRSLNIFLNKVCCLGFHRLGQLASLLSIPKDLQHRIWTCLEYCITRRPGLLKNRHLDQLMLCSFYGICKVAEKEIKFKVIIRTYDQLPHADQTVYRYALIEGLNYDSIIGFYNSVFMQNMKTYILQFAPSRPVPSLSPVPKSVTSPVYSIPNRRNFYVSPMKDSPFKTPPSPSQMTPTSRTLYCFGESGSNEKLQKINERVCRARSGIKSTTPKSLKRLFDTSEEKESVTDTVPEIPTIVKKKKTVPKVEESDTKSDIDEDSKTENASQDSQEEVIPR